MMETSERKISKFQAFVEKATKIHGGKYIYPEQEYINVSTKIRIICDIHGEFLQIPDNHTQGKGCIKCAYLKKADALRGDWQGFVKKAIAVHGDRYTYPKQEYKSYAYNVRIACRRHGEFLQTPANHIKGQGCPKCGKIQRAETKKDTFEDFLNKSTAVHGQTYTYPKQIFGGARCKVRIVCKAHGEFEQVAHAHLSGSGCPVCGAARIAITRRSKTTLSDFIKKANQVHNGRYTYPDQEYYGSDKKVRITCVEHGEFKQNPSNHLQGNGCPKCGVEKSRADKRDTLHTFIIKARRVHGDMYEYPEQEYLGAQIDISIQCRNHGVFLQQPNNHLSGAGCHKCKPAGTSSGEKQLLEYFSGHVLTNNHRIDLRGLDCALIKKDNPPNSRMELDLYFKERNLAVEFNGLYWHSENIVGKNYHKGKTKACEELGIDLIHIFEDEWALKPEIVKSIINTRLGIYKDRYYARKASLIEVDPSTAGAFYDANHIQGKTPCNKHYGLTVEGELVAMASFGNRSHLFKNNDDVELIRFCTKLHTQVVGGLSKLLSVYKSVPVKTYCDLRLFNGKGYKAVGFKELHVSPPSYFYFKGLTRLSRFNFQKHKLEKVLDIFDSSLSEAENMKNNGYSRIFDCGTLVMVREPVKSIN